MKIRHAMIGLVLPLMACAFLLYLSRPSSRPNVLLITVDTLRADHLGAYGYSRSTSPNLDAIAADGVVFEKAFAQASLSGPSHAAILTSLDVPLHGAMSNGLIVDGANLTLAEVLSGAGYATAMFVSDKIVGPRFGFEQGFDVAEVHQVAGHGAEHRHRDRFKDRQPFEAVFDAALAWLAQPREQPFFMWLHANHPHESYEPPPPFDTQFMAAPDTFYELRCGYTLDLAQEGTVDLTREERDYTVALYDGEIAYVDAQLGRLFEFLKESGQATVVILTADHGEMLLDHPTRTLSGHGRFRYDGVLRVPLIISGAPGARSGHRASSLVASMDIAPTIVELTGVHPPSSWRGNSLLSHLRGGDVELREAVFSLTTHSDKVIRTAMRTSDRKLIVDSGADGRQLYLFDLASDPLETENLSGRGEYEDVLRELLTAHDAWFSEMQSGRAIDGPNPTEAVREMLERAGYLRQKSLSKRRAERANPSE